MRFNAPISLAILLIMTLVGAGYMTIGVIDMNPAKQYTHATIMLNSSGGLMPTSQVLMRGIKVGKVSGIATTRTGLAVSIEVDGDVDVPITSPVSIANLSAAGEQYLNFAPAELTGPFVVDGSVIPASQVIASSTVSDVLARVDSFAAVVNPNDVSEIVQTLYTAVDGAGTSIEALGVTAALMAQTIHDKSETLRTLFENAGTLTDGFGAMDAGAIFSEAGALLPTASPNLIALLRAFEGYSHAGDGVWEEPIGTLVGKLEGYLGVLVPDLATFATVLKPATAQLKPLKVDAGRFIDMWSAAFTDDGAVRVAVSIPN